MKIIMADIACWSVSHTNFGGVVAKRYHQYRLLTPNHILSRLKDFMKRRPSILVTTWTGRYLLNTDSYLLRMERTGFLEDGNSRESIGVELELK